MGLYTYNVIYIHIYIERERDIEREHVPLVPYRLPLPNEKGTTEKVLSTFT